MLKLDNKGFAITGIMYTLLLLFIVIISGLLIMLGSRKSILDGIRKDILNKYDKTYTYSDEYVIDLIRNQGYIPIASEEDLMNIETLGKSYFAKGTSFAGVYEGGLDKKYVQINDITMSSAYVPVGRAAPFSGIYNGGNYKILNLVINTPAVNGVALFDEASFAKFENVNLEEVNIVGSNYVAALVAYAEYVDVNNVSVSGDISGADYVGGLIGSMFDDGGIRVSLISDIELDVVISGSDSNSSVGGLIAYIYSGNNATGTIPDTIPIIEKVTGNVEVTDAYVAGGLIGMIEGCLVRDVNLDVIMNGSANYGLFGGLIGQDSYTNFIRNTVVRSQIDVSGNGNYVGGFAGYSYRYDVDTLTVETEIMDSGTNTSIGGLSGYVDSTSNKYININATSDITSSSNYIGGAFGEASALFTFDGGTIVADISGGSYVGLFAGYGRVNAKNVEVSGTIAATGSYVGGFIGEMTSGSVENVSSSATITAGGNYIGGFIGRNTGASVISSYSVGTLSSPTGTDMGGFYGASTTTLSSSNLYSSVNVTGNTRVGGFVGSNTSSILNSYSVGSVTGVTSVGGFAGSSSSTIQNSYWNTVTSLQATSAGAAIGKTTAEMQSGVPGAGIYNTWDTGIWNFGTAVQYPSLINVGN